jgi:hypothetical protein
VTIWEKLPFFRFNSPNTRNFFLISNPIMADKKAPLERTGKLFDYLGKLSKKEEKQFLEFFPKGKEKLYGFLVALMDHRKGAKAKIPEAKLWSKATGEPYDPERNLDPQKSKILSHLQEFYAWLGFINDPFAQETYLFKEVLNRDLDKETEALYPRLQRKAQKGYPVTSDLFGFLLNLDEGYNLYYTMNGRPGKLDPMATLHGNLDAFFMARKLLFASAALTRNRLFNESHELGLIQPVLDYIRDNEESQPALVRIYYYVYLTLKEPEKDAYYDALIQLLEDHHQSLAEIEKADFYQHATNYCIRKTNQGVEGYVKKLTDLYEYQVSEGIITDAKGRLGPRNLKNIVVMMCRAKEFEWVDTFLKRFGPEGDLKLTHAYEGYAVKYNRAVWHFHQEEFEACRDILLEIWWRYKFPESYYDLDLRSYLIRTLVELRAYEDDVLLSLKDSFRKFVSENSGNTAISEHHKGNYRPFANRTNSFLNYMVSSDPDEKRLVKLQRLREQVTEQVGALNLKWLLSRIDDEIDRIQN